MTSQGSSGELLSSMISTPISTRCTADPTSACVHLSSGILAAVALIGPRLVSISVTTSTPSDPQHKGLLRLEAGGATRTAIFNPEAARQTFKLSQPGFWN